MGPHQHSIGRLGPPTERFQDDRESAPAGPGKSRRLPPPAPPIERLRASQATTHPCRTPQEEPGGAPVSRGHIAAALPALPQVRCACIGRQCHSAAAPRRNRLKRHIRYCTASAARRRPPAPRTPRPPQPASQPAMTQATDRDEEASLHSSQGASGDAKDSGSKRRPKRTVKVRGGA